jgi:hypothetical protein
MIEKNARANGYKSVKSLQDAFHVVFGNARKYNQPGSTIYKQATRLREQVRENINSLINPAPKPGRCSEEIHVLYFIPVLTLE